MREAVPNKGRAHPSGRDPDAMDRRSVYLRTLSDLSHELGRLSHPRKLADTFLLTIMGTFGITKGCVGIYKTSSLEPAFAVSRGAEERDASTLQESLPLLAAQFDQGHDRSGVLHPRIIRLNSELGMDVEEVGDGWELLITWRLGEDYRGAVVLGRRIRGDPLDGEELDMLQLFAGMLAGTFSQVLSVTNIQQLNADLERKNSGLQEALKSADRAREELDRKLYQLKTLSDLTAELTSIVNMDELLQSFLLVSMGAIGCAQAGIVLYDRESEAVRTAFRGPSLPKALQGKDAEQLIYKCLGSSAKRSLTPMTVTRLPARQPPLEQALGITLEVGLLFVVDQSLLGIACFGSQLSGRPTSDEDGDLLEALTASSLAFLKNARSFGTIQALNQDLAARNEDLTQTIAELREARFRIALLEKAKTHFKSMVLREIDRIGTARPLDFALMLALATFLGLLFNYTNPQPLPLLPEIYRRPPVQTVSSSEARKLVEEGKAVLVDARPKELHDQKHIEGAINLPLSLFDLLYMMKVARLPSDREIIVYGRTVSRLYDEDVAHRLKRRDHESVRVLEGGIEAWEREIIRSRP